MVRDWEENQVQIRSLPINTVNMTAQMSKRKSMCYLMENKL